MMKEEHNNRRIEEILSAYRPGDEALCPEEFAEALNALDSDQKLEQWFREDQIFDAAFREAMQSVPVPERHAVVPARPTVTRLSFLKLAVAACFTAALCGIGFTYFNAQNRKSAALVEDLRESMAAFAASTFELDAMNNDLAVLRDVITSSGGEFADALETIFPHGVPMGCKVVDWDGRKVSLYCFGNDARQVIHCFVVPASELNGARAAEYLKPVLEFAGRDTGGLIVDDTAYLLVSSMSGVDITPFLRPAEETYLSHHRQEGGNRRPVIAAIR